MKFKIGDEVRVLDTPSVRGWSRGQHAIGKIGVVDENSTRTIILLSNNKWAINFTEEDLELVESVEPAELSYQVF